MKYTRDYFIEKFEAIPEEMWKVGRLYDSATGACCALGHCGLRDYRKPNAQTKALIKIFGGDPSKRESNKDIADAEYVFRVNDDIFVGENPKERILNFLKSKKSL